MTREELIERVNKFQGANREFSQELPPIVEALCDEIDAAGPEVVDSLTSNSKTKALSANQGKNLKQMVDSKVEAPEVAGTAGQILQLDENGDPEWVDAQEVGATFDSVMSDSSTNAPQNKTVKAYADDNFAKKNGYYGELVSGAAENLVGRGSVPASYLFRTTGGTADVGTGTAQIKELKGNSLVWNQLVTIPSSDVSTTANGITITDNRDGSFTISGVASADVRVGIASASVFKGTHKFLCLGIVGGLDTTYYLEFGNIGNLGNIGVIFNESYGSNSNVFINVKSGTDLTTPIIVRPQLIDLTLMFGAGNEPTSVADFEADFPLGYYKNNAGEILPFLGQQIETTGFNQWDEQWESGYYDNSTGESVDNSGRIRSKNYIQVFGNTEYYVQFPSGSEVFVLFYNNNGELLQYVRKNASDAPVNVKAAECYSTYKTITTPEDCSKVMIWSIAPTYANDICINLSWSGTRNGEYEPYEVHTLDLPISTMTGKVNGEGESVVIFGSDGMNKAGAVCDSLLVDADGYARRAVKRLGKVDLGDLEWTLSYAGSMTASILAKGPGSSGLVANIICSRYTADSVNNVTTAAHKDKTIGINGSGDSIYVYDSAYTDAATFKAAMDGVYLVYELATPIEYVLDTPIYLGYYANDWGTEAIKPDNTDEPYTAPCNYDVQYGMNAVDAIRNLPRNYVSINSNGSDDSSLKALAGAISTALGIAVTWTWDEATREYTFAVADNRAFKLVSVPASASASGTAGNIAIDSSYLYICVATDTWKRVAIATWE